MNTVTECIELEFWKSDKSEWGMQFWIFSICVTLGNLLNPSEIHFPHLENGDYPVYHQMVVVDDIRPFYRKDITQGWAQDRCFKMFALLPSYNDFPWNSQAYPVETSSRADCKISPAWGPRRQWPWKHISFAILLALVTFWRVIYIIDFRLLFPKKIGPV